MKSKSILHTLLITAVLFVSSCINSGQSSGTTGSSEALDVPQSSENMVVKTQAKIRNFNPTIKIDLGNILVKYPTVKSVIAEVSGVTGVSITADELRQNSVVHLTPLRLMVELWLVFAAKMVPLFRSCCNEKLIINLFHNFTHFIALLETFVQGIILSRVKLSEEDRLVVLDEDANDLVIQVKAVLKENAGDIGEICF